MRAAGVLQARTGSTRLPGKVLRLLAGAPMLERQLERVRRARRLDTLAVATTTLPEDDALAALCARLGVRCHRGPVEDVLDRVYRAAASDSPTHVVRLTGDCPLADPAVIDALIEYCAEGGYDYASNALEPSFPDGLDVEVMRFDALESAWREASLPSEREHVTPFLYGHPGRFRIGSFRRSPDLSALRWTVDEPGDLELVERIYAELYPADPAFSTDDVLRLLERKPELKTLNTGHRRNEGYLRSLAADPR